MVFTNKTRILQASKFGQKRRPENQHLFLLVTVARFEPALGDLFSFAFAFRQ
jgi:hypothetical protein